MHAESEHVSAKSAIHILATEGIRPPESGVTINNHCGPLGYAVVWGKDRDDDRPIHELPMRPEKRAEYERYMRGEQAGFTVGSDDLMPELTPAIAHKAEPAK
jgi:hypothetical protein